MGPFYVYLIAQVSEDGLNAPVKVGMTSSPNARLSALQTGSAGSLAIQAVIALPSRATARALEAMAHAVMDADRLHGEWFSTSPLEAAGHLAACTQWLLEACGAHGNDLLDLLDSTGATAIMSRFVSEKSEVGHVNLH